MTPSASDRFMTQRDLFEMIFFFARELTVGDVLYVGAADNVFTGTGAAWAGGVYVEIVAGVMTAYVKTTSGVTIASQAFTSNILDGPVLLRIRSQLIPGAPTAQWRRFIFTWADYRQGYYDIVTGELAVNEEIVFDVELNYDSTLLEMNPGMLIRATSASQRVVQIDYISGWTMPPYMTLSVEGVGI
jgi:hypothetical protein